MAPMQILSLHLITILSIATNINEVVLVHYPNILLTERAVIMEKYQTEVLTVKVWYFPVMTKQSRLIRILYG